MYELLFLLLPVAALSGWYIGRRTPTLSTLKKHNLLRCEQTDHSLEEFIKTLDPCPDSCSDSIETIVALGNFFRQRGEVGRAIAIHQNLIAKPQLNAKERCQSLLALAQDYLSAGVYDRAENVLLEIVHSFGYELEISLSHLLDIYEREKDWEKAIQIAKQIEGKTIRKMGKQIAHYYCELAESAWAKGKVRQAFKTIRHGFSHDKKGIRLYLLKAHFEIKLGKYQRAENTLKNVQLQEKKSLYRCENCGFSSKLLHWQCPSCRRWECISPFSGIVNDEIL